MSKYEQKNMINWTIGCFRDSEVIKNYPSFEMHSVLIFRLQVENKVSWKISFYFFHVESLPLRLFR